MKSALVRIVSSVMIGMLLSLSAATVWAYILAVMYHAQLLNNGFFVLSLQRSQQRRVQVNDKGEQ